MPFAIASAAVSIGGSLFGAYNANKQRKDAKKQAQREHELAERQLGMLEKQNAQQQRRYDQNYRPIEESIARDLKAGPDLEGAANEAGGNFASEFDSASAAQERQLRQFGIRPDSQAYGRATEDQAYNRAAGMSNAQTQARRQEEDNHFIQQMGFLSGGSGIQSDVANRMAQMYGIRSGNAAQYASDASSNAQALGQFANMGINAIGNAHKSYQAGEMKMFNDPGTGNNAHNTAKQNGQYGQVVNDSPIKEVNP